MYERMYHTLFHAITDAIEMIEGQKYPEALSKLKQACQDAEEIYISAGE